MQGERCNAVFSRGGQDIMPKNLLYRLSILIAGSIAVILAAVGFTACSSSTGPSDSGSNRALLVGISQYQVSRFNLS